MKLNTAKYLLIALPVCMSSLVFAQNANTNAQQTANLGLSDAVEVTITSSATTNITFNSINDMINGVESGTQDVRVRSNKGFRVSVASASGNFTYTGNSLLNTLLPVSSVLKVKVVTNNTGGDVPLLMWLLGYQALGTGSLTILNNCDAGGNQAFSVKYKATPGVLNAGGNYSVDLIYTATQI